MKYLKNRGLLAVACALLTGALGSHQAQAVTLISAQGSANGTGNFYLNNGRADKVKTVLVVLNQNRRFSLRFTPSNTRMIMVVGTWRGSNNETATFDIENGPDGRAARGRGTVSFRRRNGKYQPDRIEFNSSTTTNKTITCRLNFDTTGVQNFTSDWSGGGNGGGGGGGGNNGPIEQLFSTKSGSGRVEVGRDRDNSVRSAKIELSRGGNARIEFTGGKTWVFAGRWNSAGTNKVRLNIDNVSSTRRTSGWLATGEITLDRGSFESIDLSGKLGSDDFKASFDAR